LQLVTAFLAAGCPGIPTSENSQGKHRLAPTNHRPFFNPSEMIRWTVQSSHLQRLPHERLLMHESSRRSRRRRGFCAEVGIHQYHQNQNAESLYVAYDDAASHQANELTRQSSTRAGRFTVEEPGGEEYAQFA